MYAASKGDIAVVEGWVTKELADPRDIDLAGDEPSGQGEFTLLLTAALHGQCGVIRFLLSAGADPDFTTFEGGFPLQVAANFGGGYREACVLLLDAGARIDARDDHDDFTPLMWASAEGNYDVVLLLLSRGAALDYSSPIPLDGIDEEWDAERLARLHAHHGCAALLAAVRCAGGWKKLVRAPRIRLLVLHSLCQEGRAVAPAGTVLERLFSPPPPPETARRMRSRSAARAARNARTALPKEIFWHVLTFWRTSVRIDSAVTTEIPPGYPPQVWTSVPHTIDV